MPDKTSCLRCGRVGFVRTETVIKGGDSYTAFYCGACESMWTEADAGKKSKRADDADRPKMN
jgi:transcription elongation factor Elf1